MMADLDQEYSLADKVKSLLDVYASKIAWEDQGISLHLPNKSLHRVPPGTMGLLLGELHSGRYGYGRDFACRAIVDIEGERARLEELDRSHPGPEHGPRRHYINHIMASQVPQGTDLLDFGCGGGGYKDYFGRCRTVTAVDVSLHALLHLRAFFPDRSRYSLHWAPLGLTDFPDDNFPSILLSAVIGVVTDSVAKIILDECHRLLRAGGTLIMALVPSRGPYEYLLGRGSLEENRNAPGTFFRKYTLAEIEAKLARRNLKVIHTSRHIVKLPPFLRASTNQFYRYKWVQWLDALINNLPGLSTWYIVVASK